jgi:hypothetical protein
VVTAGFERTEGFGEATTTGGLATTAPVSGRLAIAGDGGGATMRAPWLGSGTMRRGAGTVGATGCGAA